jgi:hypothetical protein
MPPVVTRTIYNIGLRYTADTIVEERQQLSENKRCFFGLLSYKRGVQVTSVILWAVGLTLLISIDVYTDIH